ncbi:glycosyltransferase [Escherichia coli]|nr:glycosyltransferase [Escherichia coli]
MAHTKMKKTKSKIKKIFNSIISKESEIKGHFDVFDGNCVHGWAIEKVKNSPVTLSLYINDVLVKKFSSGLYRKDLSIAGINNGFAGFSEPLDLQKIVTEYGFDCSISIKSEFGHYELKNSPKKLSTPEIVFSLDIYENGVAAGWVVDRNNEGLTLSLEMNVNNTIFQIPANLLRSDLSSIGITNCNHGFYVNAFELAGTDQCDITIKLKYDKEYIIAPKEQFTSFSSKIKCLTDLQSYLRQEKYSSTSYNAHQLVHSIIPAIIDQCRTNKNVPMNKTNNIESITKNDSVAIIIPVYKGVEETINCLKSVIQAKNDSLYRVIVINDCSPDLDMKNELAKFKNHSNIELFNNEINLGFVGTVNRGMLIAEGQDVILLNSDTIVADGWLDAILKEAYYSVDSDIIGTVTPISNNATICSFPEFCTDNELPANYDVHKLAAFCNTNIAPAQELPTAHGYCMFIKRSVLNDVGYFDQQKWGKGYAEENDFSLRASKLGWKHVVTNKTFVHHLGSVSFANNAEEFISKNLEKLNAIYPDYPELVAKFVKKDPVRLLRKELATKIIKNELSLFSQKPILFVSLVIGGGTKVATDEMERLLNKEDYPVIMLTCRENGMWRLSLEQIGIFCDYNIDNEYNEFISFLQELKIWHIHYHHTLQFPTQIWDIPELLQCKYDVTLHDYYTVCPRANMVSYGDKFCDTPTNDLCNNCIRDMGVHDSSKLSIKDVGGNIESWRQFHGMNLAKARKVYTPSKDTMLRISKYIPIDNIDYRYHPETIIKSSVNHLAKSKINIGFIGAIGPHKGINVIKGLADHISKNNIQANLTIIGYTSDDEFFSDYDFVKITGKYSRKNFLQLFENNGVDIIFITSIWPETFSYTFTEAISSNLPIATFDIGAVLERSDNMQSVLRLSLESSYESIFNAIKNYLSTPVYEERQIGVQYPSIINDYYNIEVE